MIRTLLLFFIAGAVASCTDPVKDIDRTQGNFIKKADLEGEWYFMQTITDVPPTSAFTFIGETSKMERIRWVVQEDLLVAYRSYPQLPGADAPSTGEAFDGYDNPIAAYPIYSHFDIIRDYNSSTGEQSNVLIEDSSDRMWHEREYVRVDWTRSDVVNFEFIAPTAWSAPMGYFVQEEQGGPDAFYREETDGVMNYFDVMGKMFVEPDFWGCIFTWYGWAAEDCASAEITVRSSFSRVPESDYEPFHYDDRMMSRYGYFRTERYTYDEQRGVLEGNRRYLINRHNIWQQSRDDAGNPIPIPDRAVRTVPYYLSPTFPDDDLLQAAAQKTMQQWSDAAKRGVRAATGQSDVPEVFVLCQNPVAEGDHAACGEAGFIPRMGDLRYSTLHWVDPETVYGLLGYGPSGADPITGETIAGKAYVYGAAVNTWATYAVDVIRYFNNDLELDTLVHGRHFADEIADRLQGLPGVAREVDPKLKNVPLTRHMHARERPERPQPRREDLKPYDGDRIQRRMDAAREAGMSPMIMNDEVKKSIAGRRGMAWDDMPDDIRDQMDPTRVLNPIALKKIKKLRDYARSRSADFDDMVAPDIQGLVSSYAGRTDYEEMWREIRADIFAAVAEHEVGHTLGLRHNFQGSYDSLNFFDKYWELREETLQPANTLADIYTHVNLTLSQHEGQMRQQQYSSIMDYGYTWQNDLAGIGKYDAAALIFGYTTGSYRTEGAQCGQYESVPAGGGCIANMPGYIEVFKKRRDALGQAGAMFDRGELGFTFDDPGLPSVNLLERYHYSTVALALPSLDDLGPDGRELMRYSDYLTAKAEGGDRPIRIPHLFCSDEWEGGLISCHAFDQGADPFELTLSKIHDYRAYYPFVNFKRDRIYFDVWDPLFIYFWRTFLPISDYFQSWYVAPFGDDPLFDRTYDLAINSGFNLLAEVIATPPYGTYCAGNNGRLVWLDDEFDLRGEGSDDPDCAPSAETYEIEAGIGRRRFSTYDPDLGYLFHYKPQEAGHYWATLAALWAMVDPDAYVVGVEGDAGTFAISYYDWFDTELEGLLNNVLAENYAKFAPRARLIANDDNKLNLTFVPAVPLFDRQAGAYFDAERGVEVPFDPSAGPIAGPTGLCEPCETDNQCAGHTGFLEGTFCQPIDGEARYCLLDCTDTPEACPAGTECDGVGNCVPSDARCAPLVEDCSAGAPYGSCPDNSTCVAGTCEEFPWAPAIETEPTFSLSTDILWYGFLFTTASYSTRFNDQLNVFRPGTDSEVEVDPRFSDTFAFTDPISGVQYAAVQPRCTGNGLLGGPTARCGGCEEHTDCAGFINELGGIYCQPINGNDDPQWYCLRDCTNDAGSCPDDHSCNGAGNCVPDSGLCLNSGACSAENPVGSCPDGSTCNDGACEEVLQPSEHCRFLRPDDTGAVQLIKRGQALADKYNADLAAWYSFQGDDAEDTRLARVYFRSRYRLTSHIDLLETVVATYNIFGRIY